MARGGLFIGIYELWRCLMRYLVAAALIAAPILYPPVAYLYAGIVLVAIGGRVVRAW